jgi:signal transduction histidine kinase
MKITGIDEMYIIRSQRLQVTLIVSGFLAVFVIGWADYLTWLEMSFSIFYLLPVILITWSSNMWTGISASLLSAIVWSTADRMGGHVYSYEWVPYWNTFVRFGFYVVIAVILSRLKTSYEDRANLIQELEGTVRTLNQYKGDLEAKAGELTRSNKDLEHFASAAAHDTVTDGVSRMEKMINGLLNYARVETKGREFAWSSGEKVLDSAINGVRNSIEESCAVLTRDTIPDLMVDEVQLSQVFQNLIANAIKFRSESPPRIHVSAELDGDEWIFTVQDNSIGISQEHFEKIFGIFKRVHSERDYPGCGIGLALCRKIVERHGGRIWVESEVGKGSVFYFSVPAVKQSETAA